MLLKTKLLLLLGTCGVSGGVGVGVYYIKNRKVDGMDKKQKSDSASDGGAGEQGSSGAAA